MQGPPPDASHVRCDVCGAWCKAANVDEVRCGHCGAAVKVPEDVRFVLRNLGVVRDGAALVAERAAQVRAIEEGKRIPRDDEVPPPDLAVLETRALCARCGRPLVLGADAQRCASCGADAAPEKVQAIGAIVRGLESQIAKRNRTRDEILRIFPVAKQPAREGDPWLCGGCGEPIRAPPPRPNWAFDRCDGCGKQNYSMEAMSMVAAYRAIGSGLSERDATTGAHVSRAELRARSKVMFAFAAFCVVVYALIHWGIGRSPSNVSSESPRSPTPTFTVVDIPRMPDFVIYPDAGAGECDRLRALGGECVWSGTARVCDSAGVVEERRCWLLMQTCARDACAPGAACCIPHVDAGRK
jgi:ribosomal protein L37E